jgi:hypothetical protein
MGCGHQHTGNAARLTRGIAQAVKRCVAEAPAEIERYNGQALAAGFENQHSRIQWIERALGWIQPAFESPHYFVGGGRNIGFGNAGAKARPSRE